MSDEPDPLSIIVLGDPTTPVGAIVQQGLAEAQITAHFVDTTLEYLRLADQIDTSRLIVLEPDWWKLLRAQQPKPRLLIVREPGDEWSPEWKADFFEIQDESVGPRFGQYVTAWITQSFWGL